MSNTKKWHRYVVRTNRCEFREPGVAVYKVRNGNATTVPLSTDVKMAIFYGKDAKMYAKRHAEELSRG